MILDNSDPDTDLFSDLLVDLEARFADAEFDRMYENFEDTIDSKNFVKNPIRFDSLD